MNDTNMNQIHSPSSSTAPVDLSAAVEVLINRISSLSSVYEAETDALRRADTEQFSMIQTLKIEEAYHYEQDIQAVLQNGHDLTTIDPTLKEKLKALQEEFSSLVKDNALALSRMQATTQRLSRTILKAKRKAFHNETAVNYGESGRLLAEDRKNIPTGRVSKEA